MTGTKRDNPTFRTGMEFRCPFCGGSFWVVHGLDRFAVAPAPEAQERAHGLGGK